MRRWYVAVPVFVTVLLAGALLVRSAEATFEASGSVVVLPYDPTIADPPVYEEILPPRNPYADFSGSVNVTAQILADAGTADTFRRGVVDDGGTADFTVSKAEDGPILAHRSGGRQSRAGHRDRRRDRRSARG